MTSVIEFSLPVPRAPHAILHARLSFLTGCAMIHLTTSELGESGSLHAPLGSFVYSMPGVSLPSRNCFAAAANLMIPQSQNNREALSTTLCSAGYSIDYATRLSKILARRLRLPVYVGCSMSFAGISPEEEMEGLSLVVKKILAEYEQMSR